uniref:Nitric oxide synthase 1 adaptor protein n=1 Tax=Latimeria chalumnae TaxID=7897 RepID=H3B376_LATCH
MFENSNTACTPKLQHSKSLSLLAKSSSGTISSFPATETTGPKMGSTQHLKNLGKAVGAKVNDFLRRKETVNLGSIGVTEVNKNVGAVLAVAENNSQQRDVQCHKSLDIFPRLDPPPPAARKRTPRALKTTQDMMISPDPVVTSTEATDTSFTAMPECIPLLTQGIPQDKSAKEEEKPLTSKTNTEKSREGISETILSVPDLLNKDTLDLKLKTADSERKLSLPKTHLKITLSEDDLLENGSEDSGVPRYRNSSVDEEESHPDLLSFE